MIKDDEFRFWLLVLSVVCVTFAALFAMNRLLPDRSLQCVQAGGSWHTDNDGYCEGPRK